MELRFVRRKQGDLAPRKILQFREELDDDGQSYMSDWKDVPEVDED